MNKQDRKKVWNYFIEQKIVELCWIFLGIFGIIYVPYYLGKIGWHFNILWFRSALDSIALPETFPGNLDFWWLGFLYLIAIAIIFVICYAWFQYNWEKAEERVKQEKKI